MPTFQISQQMAQAAIAQRVAVKVAHKEAQLICFADAQGGVFSWAQLARALAEEAGFCDRWNQTWADLPFDFEWKPVPIHPYTAQTHPFFAIAFPAQFRPANPQDFDQHLMALAPDALTAAFNNFSGDAQLIAPKAVGEFGHIGAFCRTASVEMVRSLWRQVGEICLEAILQEEALWCNTHGHGVPWLHVRFDSRLKYSAFPPRGNITANAQAIWYQIYEDAEVVLPVIKDS